MKETKRGCLIGLVVSIQRLAAIRNKQLYNHHFLPAEVHDLTVKRRWGQVWTVEVRRFKIRPTTASVIAVQLGPCFTYAVLPTWSTSIGKTTSGDASWLLFQIHIFRHSGNIKRIFPADFYDKCFGFSPVFHISSRGFQAFHHVFAGWWFGTFFPFSWECHNLRWLSISIYIYIYIIYIYINVIPHLPGEGC